MDAEFLANRRDLDDALLRHVLLLGNGKGGNCDTRYKGDQGGEATEQEAIWMDIRIQNVKWRACYL